MLNSNLIEPVVIPRVDCAIVDGPAGETVLTANRKRRTPNDCLHEIGWPMVQWTAQCENHKILRDETWIGRQWFIDHCRAHSKGSMVFQRELSLRDIASSFSLRKLADNIMITSPDTKARIYLTVACSGSGFNRILNSVCERPIIERRRTADWAAERY